MKGQRLTSSVALLATATFLFAACERGTVASAGTGGRGGTSAAAGAGGGGQGVAGGPGAAGTKATAGTTGTAGSTGAAGTSGAAGTTGTAGSTGAAGTSGAAGMSGAAGTGAGGNRDAGIDGPVVPFDCAQQPAGTVCAPGSCMLAVEVPPSTCNGAGQCVSPPAIPCAPHLCGANGQCRTNCESDAYCSGGYCTPELTCLPFKAVGQPCTRRGECATGFCANGVCCETQCLGECRSCAMAGSVGTCNPFPAGTVCINRFICDGNGFCMPPP